MSPNFVLADLASESDPKAFRRRGPVRVTGPAPGGKENAAMTERHESVGETQDSVLLQRRRPIHPALARAHDQLTRTEPAEITSYDRMHHRHNRS
jgi:hypothetical protein